MPRRLPRRELDRLVIAAVEAKLDAIFREMRFIRRNQERLMDAAADVKAAIAGIATDIDKISTDTTAVLTLVQNAQQPDGSITPADAASILASLGTLDTSAKDVATRLEAAIPPAPPPPPAS